ncbi:MAG: NUDIX hydrolase [Burkholderiales bacterium]
MIWKPNVTVAAVLEQDGKFLLVEEKTEEGIQFNQPAGHWEPGETLAQGVIRETLEESAYHFFPEFLLGIYAWRHPRKDLVYLRFAYGGKITGFDPGRRLDDGILRAVWLDPEEIRAGKDRHRSPLVTACVEDYLAGKRYPMEFITQL